MPLPPLNLPPSFSFIKTFLFLSLFIMIPTNFAASDDVADEGFYYEACAPFSCGNFSDIRYPFWSSNQPDYCGHPKFKLDCEQGNLTIDIMSQKFHIIDINQSNQFLKIARLDFWVDPSCSNNGFTNFSLLDLPFFNYTTNDFNITFLYECDPPPTPSYPSSYSYSPTPNNNNNNNNNAYPWIYTCSTDGNHYAYLVLTSTSANDFSSHGCMNSAKVPVLKDSVLSVTSDVTLGAEYILEKGFEVRWNGVNKEQCDGCIQSGGRCGHNNNNASSSFICLCPNNHQKPYYDDGGHICPSAMSPLPAPTTPHFHGLSPNQEIPNHYYHSVPSNPPRTITRNTLDWRRKIGIAVGAAAFGALAVSIGVYIYQRRKKNRYTMPYVQSQSFSTSDPSSIVKDPEKGSQYFGAHVFTYDELEEATNNFDSTRELGDGGFGTVYYGELHDGRRVAVKRLYENNYRRVEQFMNEVEILTGLRHPNLVSLFGCTSRHSRELLLVYEYIPNGTVADHLHSRKAKPDTVLPWHTRMNIAVETASALKYLHASEIIHRDVKTNNILLDSHFCVKVADFGLSRLFPVHATHVSTAPQGTPGYVDPEYHECYQLTSKSDVYSFGVVLIELISSLPAVDITRHRHEINLSTMAINKIHNQALHELVDPKLGFETDFKVRKMINAVAELAYRCLQSSKDMRPSMEEVLENLLDIQSDGDGKHKSQPEVLDISVGDDVVLLKDDPPPPSPDSNVVSKSTTPNASG